MYLVKPPVKDTIEVKEALASNEFVDLGFLLGVQGVVVCWEFWWDEARWVLCVRVLEEARVAGCYQEGGYARVLPVDYGFYFEGGGVDEDVAGG
jgi:hypothetical protein